MTSTLNFGSKIPMSEVDGLTTAMSNKADINFVNVLGGGVKACFRWLKPDLTRGVHIADCGSMPFDGWASITAQAWSGTNQEVHKSYAYINGKQVVFGGCNSSGSTVYNTVFIPVKTGDVFTTRKEGSGGSLAACTLYPYEALPEEETEV